MHYHAYQYTQCSGPKSGATAPFQAVPDRFSGWEETFVIPQQFSERIMVALAAGEIADFVRHGIVKDVAAMILNKCKYPTSDQLQVVVASKIVKAYPILQDTIGTGHVSEIAFIVPMHEIHNYVYVCPRDAWGIIRE